MMAPTANPSDLKVNGSTTLYSRQFQYDAVRNRPWMNDGTGSASFTYNNLNQLMLIQHPDTSQTT